MARSTLEPKDVIQDSSKIKQNRSEAAPAHKWKIILGACGSTCFAIALGYMGLNYLAQQQLTSQEAEVKELLADGKTDQCLAQTQALLSNKSLLHNFWQTTSYFQVQTIHDQCQQLKTQQTTLTTLQSLKSQGKYDECITQAHSFPEPKSSQIYSQAHNLLGECLLAKAKQLDNGDRLAAVQLIMTQINSDMSVYADSRQVANTWSDKLLESAEQKYLTATNNQGFQEAIQLAAAIPQNTSAYTKAQAAIQKWKQEEEKNRNADATAKQAFKDKRLQDARTAANQLLSSSVTYWQKAGQTLIDKIEKFEQPINVAGRLTDSSPKLAEGRVPYTDYSFYGYENQALMVTMESSDFDTQIFLIDSNGDVIARSDDGFANGLDSVIRFTLSKEGNYRVRASAYTSSGRGAYHLTTNSR